jgi:hypothetical protein
MDLSLPAAPASLNVPKRWLLFGAAVVLGTASGIGWPLEISGWAYDGLLRFFIGPGFQIASLAVAVGLGFVLGLVHLTTI